MSNPYLGQNWLPFTYETSSGRVTFSVEVYFPETLRAWESYDCDYAIENPTIETESERTYQLSVEKAWKLINGKRKLDDQIINEIFGVLQ